MYFSPVRFTLEISEELLGVLELIFNTINWSKDRAVVSDLRREIVRWLTRIMRIESTSSSEDNFQSEISIATLMYWKNQFKKYSSLPSGCVRALEWISAVQIESIFLGSLAEDIPVSRSGRKGDKPSVVKYDRTLLTMENLYTISSVIDRKDVLQVFSEAVVQAARTAQLSDLIRTLFLSVEKAKNNSDISYSYSFVFQNVLYYRMDLEYKQMIRRLLKNRDLEFETELREWEIQSELIFYEPFLWAKGIQWLRSDYYKCCHVTNKGNEALYSFLNKLVNHFSSISECILSGQLPIDFIKRLYSCQNQILEAWIALGSPLADNSVLELMNTDIDSAFADNKTIIKVL